MCLNCGCGLLDDDMGNQDNLTKKDIEKAAAASGESMEETVDHTIQSLQKLKQQSQPQQNA